jgi:DNA-binding SARP family transcriptional activator
MNANRVVPTERIIELLWGGDAPAGASHAVHSYMSALRGFMPPEGGLVNARPGYHLEVDPGHVDLHEFRGLVVSGRQRLRACDPDAASEQLRSACDIWRDATLPDFPDSLPMRGLAMQLVEELHLAEDLLVDALLATGRADEVIPRLVSRTTERPGHERAWQQLMVALYRADRRVQALATYTLAREALLEESGIEPSARTRELHAKLLNDDPVLLPQ